MRQRQYEAGDDYVKCQKLLDDMGIKITCDFVLRAAINCDYYGFNDKEDVIIERKSSALDAERSIVQVLKYNEMLKELRSKHRRKWRPLRIIIFYDTGVDLGKFLKFHSMYRDYIQNPRCPAIMWCYRDVDENVVILT